MRDVLRGVLGRANGAAVRDDLVVIGAAAVMGRAMPLGDTLVLPSHVVLTLPAQELRLFASQRQQADLTAALRREVAQQAEAYVVRLRQLDGEPVAVVGEQLRIGLVEGQEREADARFSGPERDRLPAAGVPGAGVPGAGVPGAGVPAASLTELATCRDSGLRLVLRCDGEERATVPVAVAPVTVGRDPTSALVVPESKEKVSRRALVVTRSAETAVEVVVVNRHGVWTTGAAGGGRRPLAGRAGRRSKHRSGVRFTLGVGERIDLDQAATVSLALEGRMS